MRVCRVGLEAGSRGNPADLAKGLALSLSAVGRRMKVLSREVTWTPWNGEEEFRGPRRTGNRRDSPERPRPGEACAASKPSAGSPGPHDPACLAFVSPWPFI